MRDIVVGKLIDHTIDADYEDLSELLFGDGNCFSSSETRKRMYGMRAIIEAIERESEQQQNTDTVADIDMRKIELQKAQQKFYDQRREYNKLVQNSAREEHLYQSLVDAANNLIDTIGPIYTCRESENIYQDKSENTNEAVLVFSDWHYGMKADNIFNNFNKNECVVRVCSVVSKAIDRMLLHHCSTLHVVVLGDLWHGAIHTSARVASEELVCDQIMQVSELLAQSIERLSLYANKVVVHSTYGNHARTVQNKSDSIHRDNMERIVPWWLKERLKHIENIEIVDESSTEFVFINACGHEICAAHGDLDSVKASTRLISTLMYKRYRKNIEYIILGDKHHNESFDELGVTSTICGSLCGTDDYANDKRLYSTPSQLMLIVNEQHGVDAEYKLKCI